MGMESLAIDHRRFFVELRATESVMAKILERIRMTLPSRTGSDWLKAMLRIAPAVYGPIPGRLRSSVLLSGTRLL